MPPFLPARGSSPRARGTENLTHDLADDGRFIPASAGNRPRPLATRANSPVHPRERGEQDADTSAIRSAAGSSPRARGTADNALAACKPVRFIPASAGNSRRRMAFTRRTTVHPRERGEQRTRGATCSDRSGSSPRARGTASPQIRDFMHRRFIPASAGNRKSSFSKVPSTTVHPRERGEQEVVVLKSAIHDGSSPRARGTGMQHAREAAGLRFIPASAGNRRRCRSRPRPASVHPRERGEQMGYGAKVVVNDGSSPRARGTGVRIEDLAKRFRFIPASAGNRW